MIVYRVQDTQILLGTRSDKYLAPGEYATELDALTELKHRLVKAHAAAVRHLELVYLDLLMVQDRIESAARAGRRQEGG